MFIGHFAVGFATKRYAPRTSLGALLAASVLCDLLWPLFLLFGWEVVRIDPSGIKMAPFNFVSYPWSHSLLMCATWAALFASIYYGISRYTKGSVAIALGVLSHWVLHWITHRPDLPLYPGGKRFGLGLWNFPYAAVILELFMFAAGVSLWDSLTKWRRVMNDIILHGQKHDFLPESCDPMKKVDVTASSSSYEAIVLTPKQTFVMLNSLPLFQQTMVVLDAATGIRYSEIAGLQWKDVDWEDKCIYIERRWIRGNVHKPKTPASKAAVAMSDVLAAYLLAWRKETMYGKDTDWIFASSRTKGKTPRVGNMLVRSYLYPAAVKAGVLTTTNIKVMRTVRKKGKKEKAEVEVPIFFDKKGKRVKRFGFHQFRHSLSSFLTTKKKVDPKTAQTALRQSDSRFTLDKYTQTDKDELLAAQNLMLHAIFETEPRRAIQ